MTSAAEEPRVALVSGAAKRTGAAIVRALAQAGYRVFIHYRRSAVEAAQLAAELTRRGSVCDTVQADLGTPGGSESLVAAVRQAAGRLDVLVNNVGNYPTGNPLALSGDEFRATLETNLVAPYLLTRAAADLLCAHQDGNVINIGYVGVDHAVANRTAMAYQISKTGLLVLTKTLAQELGSRGLRVNMVSPGHLDNSVDLPQTIADHVPLGRPGEAREIADCIVFLLSRGAYITGANIEVAGGYRLALARSLLDD